MAEDQPNLPNLPAPIDPMLPTVGMSPALQIMLNPVLFERAQTMARFMSQAVGFLPKHLINSPAACFAVLTRSITWKLDPYAVAQSTFVVPGSDKVGYEGKLIAAILENSGKLDGPVRHTHFGPWEKVVGKFHIGQSRHGKEIPIPDWKAADAEGCGITISAQVKGEAEPRTYDFLLVQAYPLNSPLWATDPKTQIFYAAVRRFASVVASGLLMGVPWEGDELPGDNARDVTPAPAAPARGDFEGPAGTRKTASPANGIQPDKTASEVVDAERTFAIILNDGSEVEAPDAKTYADWLLKEATRLVTDKALLDGLWESNSPTFGKLPPDIAEPLRAAWPAYKAPIPDTNKTKPAGEGKLV